MKRKEGRIGERKLGRKKISKERRKELRKVKGKKPGKYIRKKERAVTGRKLETRRKRNGRDEQ